MEPNEQNKLTNKQKDSQTRRTDAGCRRRGWLGSWVRGGGPSRLEVPGQGRKQRRGHAQCRPGWGQAGMSGSLRKVHAGPVAAPCTETNPESHGMRKPGTRPPPSRQGKPRRSEWEPALCGPRGPGAAALPEKTPPSRGSPRDPCCGPPGTRPGVASLPLSARSQKPGFSAEFSGLNTASGGPPSGRWDTFDSRFASFRRRQGPEASAIHGHGAPRLSRP